jgi:WD40 repeat protein
VRTRRVLGTPLQGYSAAVWSVAFDPKGEILCAGDNNGALLFWDVANRRRLGESVPGYSSRVSSLAFSPDGKMLAAAGFRGTLQFIDAESHQPLGNPIFPEGEYDSVNAVAYSPDGKTLAAALNNPPGLLLLDGNLDTWQLRAARRANRNLSLAEWKRFFGTLPYRRTFADLPPGDGVSDN